MIIYDLPEIERRLEGSRIAGLLEMWRSRGDGRLPAWRDFDILELRPWMGRLTLVELLIAERDIHWRVFGTEIAEQLQRDLTGCRYSERPEWVEPSVVDAYWDTAARAVPTLQVLDDRNQDGQQAVLLRLMLPLADDGGRVEMVMTAYGDVATGAGASAKPAIGAA